MSGVSKYVLGNFGRDFPSASPMAYRLGSEFNRNNPPPIANRHELPKGWLKKIRGESLPLCRVTLLGVGAAALTETLAGLEASGVDLQALCPAAIRDDRDARGIRLQLLAEGYTPFPDCKDLIGAGFWRGPQGSGVGLGLYEVDSHILHPLEGAKLQDSKPEVQSWHPLPVVYGNLPQ